MKRVPTHYVVHIGHSTQTKNNLQKEFMAVLKSLEGDLYPADRVAELKRQILQKAEDLNFKHYRCQPLKIDFEESYDKTGLVLRGFPFLIFHIDKAYLINS